jgi:outer membrane protein OmpA-like peptidoglycan-associated protein
MMRSLRTCVCVFAVLVAARAPAADEVMSNEQIQQALKPQLSRGFTPRGLTRREHTDATTSVNLNIPFDHNSSSIKPEASSQLKQLELALSSSDLSKNRFIVAGHTDAKGSAQHNKLLSLRRAEAVKRFLVVKGMNPSRLDAVGYGSEQLLEPDHPDDPRNRRVEIRNLGAAPQ